MFPLASDHSTFSPDGFAHYYSEPAIQFFAERHLIKFLQDRPVEPFADAVCLRRHCFGFRVVDIIYCQIKLVIMLLYFATVLCAPVGQYSQHWQALRRVKWHSTGQLL